MSQRHGSIVLFLGVTLGCATPPPRYPITDPALALGAVHARDARVHSIRAEGSADHFGAHGRIRGTVHVFIQRPRRLRVDTEAFGNTLSAVSSDGTDFTLSDFQHGRFYQGPAEPCVAAQLLGIPLEPAEVVAVMAGGPPLLDGNPHIHWAHGHYVMDIQGADGATESVEMEIPSSERESTQPTGQHPRPSRAVLRDARGVRAEITFEDYTDIDGVAFPRRVRVVMERDQVDLMVRYRSVEINPDLPDDAWTQHPAAGMEVIPVGCAAPDGGTPSRP